MTRLSWRENGKTGHGFGAKSYSLWNGTVKLATAQSYELKGREYWFWYGDGINTCHNLTDLATAKAGAIAHFKAKGTIPKKPGWYWATHVRGGYETMPVYFQIIHRGPVAYVPNETLPAEDFHWHEPCQRKEK